MNFNNSKEIAYFIKDFENRAGDLIHALPEDETVDFYQLFIMAEKLHSLVVLTVTDQIFCEVFAEILNMTTDEDMPKVDFLIEKHWFHHFGEDFLMIEINHTLDVVRNFNFYDYRARNFQEDVCRAMEEVKAWYKKEYNL